ncbi:MAG: serine/threonine protein kinase [Candidatus Obscuribacter sp.]|nr:serine/threonine protein kinase [Candidatus Obscuribacter sp.]
MSQWQPNEKLKPTLSEVMEPVAPAVELVVKEETETVEPKSAKSPSGDATPSPNNPTAHSGETPPDLGPRYDVLELVGSGGMGTVWKVYDKQLAETFAIKVLKPELISDATALKRFEKEANLASDLTHANIAAIFGPGTDDKGRPYIIMRFVDGESLADILAREGKFSEERALDIFSQICEALSHSHMKGIVHRDIKPSNIIISKTESGGDMVHIVDFGIARCVYDEVTKTQALTKAVDVFGSPRYMSPEQLLGQTATEQSDIYSLGCVLYEMLTGAPPFTEDNPVKLILQHISEPPDLSKVPVQLQSILYLCLAKEAEMRLPSIGHIQERLSMLKIIPSIQTPNSIFLHLVMCPALLFFALPLLASSQYPSLTMSPFTAAAMLLIWMYLAKTNRENAGRSQNYQLLEINLLLNAVSGLLLNFLAFFLILSKAAHPISIYLAAFLVAAVNCWILTRKSTPAAYSKLFGSLFNKLLKKRIGKYRVSLYKFARFQNHFGLAALSLINFFPLMIVLSTQLWAPDFPSTALTDSRAVFSAIFCMGGLMSAVWYSLTEFFINQRKVKSSLKVWLAVQACSILLTLTSLLAANAAFGQNSLAQYYRQFMSFTVKSDDQKPIRLEALKYPNSMLGAEAKLRAAQSLQQNRNHEAEALTLCNQIIDGKGGGNPITLADAYILRTELRGDDISVQAANKDDLTQALNSLTTADLAKTNWIESATIKLERNTQTGDKVISIGTLAASLGDKELSIRALNVVQAMHPKQGSALKLDMELLEQTIQNWNRPKYNRSFDP